MPKFPEPPPVEELRAIDPVVAVLPDGSRLFRLYRRGGDHPTAWNTFRHYGPLNGRFDHHVPDTTGAPRVQGRAISYFAEDGPTCLAEVFQDTKVIDRLDREPWLVSFEVTRSIELLDLTSVWPTRAGASMAINSGPRPRAQQWAQRIYEAYPDLAGIVYSSSMYANRPMTALWERGQDALPALPSFHRALSDPSLTTLLQNTAVDITYGLV